MSRKPSKRAATPATPPLVLAETLDLPAASPLVAEFLTRRGQDLAIDASATQRLGGQCLQVLLSARATWATDGHAFRFVAASPEFTEAVALLGAADLALIQDA